MYVWKICMEMFMNPQMEEVKYVNSMLKNNKNFEEFQQQIIAV